MNTHDELQSTIAKLTAPGKGIVPDDAVYDTGR